MFVKADLLDDTLASVAQLVVSAPTLGGDGLDSGPRDTKIVENDMTRSSFGT